MTASTRIVLGLVVLFTGTACGSRGNAGMPSGDHLHSLGVTVDGDLLLGLHGALYRSDEGTTWELVALEGQDAMVIASAEQPVFVAGHEVFARSNDGGATFVALRPSTLPGLDIHALAQGVSAGRVIYAFVVGHGLFASADAGDTWEPRSDLAVIPPDTFALAVVESGTDTLVAAAAESGLLRSDDGGRSFSQVWDGSAWSTQPSPESYSP